MDLGPQHENDFALKNYPANDDLDRKTPRTQLELEALRQTAEAWQARLSKVERSLRRYLDRVQSEMRPALLRELEDTSEPNPEALPDMLTGAGGIGMAQEIIARVRRAASAIETHMAQRENDYMQGRMPTNLKGRIRLLRAEVQQSRLDAEEAQRVLAQGEQHWPAEVVQRLHRDISRYRQSADQLRSMEAQLVDPTVYRAVGESDHFHNLVLAHLAGGQ